MEFQLKARPAPFDNLLRRLQSGSAWLFAGLMLGNAVAYLYQMLMARMLSPVDYGALVTLTSVSYVLTVLMRTFQAWVIKAVAVKGSGGDGQVHRVVAGTMRTLLPLGVLAFACHWVAAGWVANFLHLGGATPVIVLGVYTFSAFLAPVPRGVLLGLDRLYTAGWIQVAEPVARLGAGAVLVLLGLGVNGAIGGFAAGNVVAFIIALVVIWPLVVPAPHTRQPVERVGALDRYALLMLVINAGLTLIASVDQIAVKHYFSEQVAGNFAVAFLLGQVIVMTTMALGWVVFTRSATASAMDERPTHVLTRGLIVISMIAITLTCGYLAAPVVAVRLMGGAQYGSAARYVGLVGIEKTLFALVYIQAYYHISVKKMWVIWPLCFATLAECILLIGYHDTVGHILTGLIVVMALLLVSVSALSWGLLRANSRDVLRTFSDKEVALP